MEAVNAGYATTRDGKALDKRLGSRRDGTKHPTRRFPGWRTTMGMIRVELMGSFGVPRSKTFSAMGNGHASAVAAAIAYLATEEMPQAIANDHTCHNEDAEPSNGFAGVKIKK